jgi:hypothetical protein
MNVIIFKPYLVSLRNRSGSDTGKFGYIDVDQTKQHSSEIQHISPATFCIEPNKERNEPS